MDEPSAVTVTDVLAAWTRIRPHVHRSPIMTSRTLDTRVGTRVVLKCENLQRGGAFKIRGAVNAVYSLDDTTARRGVATHSSGNHAQALAIAARLRGIIATIVMPEGSPRVKVQAVRDYGAQIIFSGNTQQDRERVLAEVVSRSGAEVVHPSDDLRVIAGQGTWVPELLLEVPEVDLILTPVGGGGLLSGTAVASRGLVPATRVIGVEPEAADDAARSFRTGVRQPALPPRTVADGLRTSLGPHTFDLVRRHVDDIVTVSEEAIVRAMRFAWERLKLVIEPSAAVPLAALLEGAVDTRGGTVAVVLSGGNVDLDTLPWAAPRG